MPYITFTFMRVAKCRGKVLPEESASMARSISHGHRDERGKGEVWRVRDRVEP
jgi:hypothetical protein